MFRPAFRVASTPILGRAVPRPHVLRRFASTAPPHHKSRSWKSSAARWGLAGALVYYYNTSSAFAEEPSYAIHAPPETPRETETYPTVESVSEQRRAAQSRPQSVLQQQPQSTEQHPSAATATASAPDGEPVAPGSPEALEEEAGEQGAFNEETGEINWDCPCLGGMAHGPCGEQFRAAFSCFVYSKEEPKGVDCIDHFKAMQNCFREHPDIYGAELEDEGEAPPVEQEGEVAPVAQAASVGAAGSPDRAAAPSSQSAAGVDKTAQEQR